MGSLSPHLANKVYTYSRIRKRTFEQAAASMLFQQVLLLILAAPRFMGRRKETMRENKLEEILSQLEQGITALFESERYSTYLKTLSKFHSYSLNNTILIVLQNPEATHVAGYTAWKKDFGRQVVSGETGIKIIAPIKVKKEAEVPEAEDDVFFIPAFKIVTVFDISQTKGKELPTIGIDMLTGDVETYRDFFIAIEKASPVPVAFEQIEGRAKGYYHLEERRVVLKQGMSELQTLKTAIHEIAHAKLHGIEQNDQPPKDHHTREVEAESVAYTVCQHYGLDTSEYSFGYIAGWSSGKELAELKASLEIIRATSADLIVEIDGHFAGLQQDRNQFSEHVEGYEDIPTEILHGMYQNYDISDDRGAR